MTDYTHTALQALIYVHREMELEELNSEKRFSLFSDTDAPLNKVIRSGIESGEKEMSEKTLDSPEKVIKYFNGMRDLFLRKGLSKKDAEAKAVESLKALENQDKKG